MAGLLYREDMDGVRERLTVWWNGGDIGRPAVHITAPRAEPAEAPWSRRLLTLALASGFATIGLELLWTRMLALVLQNSVYSFGSVVAVFLAGLSIGASLVAWRLRRYPAWRILRLSLLATAVLVALTPAVLTLLTGGLQPFSAGGSWLTDSLSSIALTAAVVLLPVYITLRSLDLEFLAQFGADYDMLQEVASD